MKIRLIACFLALGLALSPAPRAAADEIGAAIEETAAYICAAQPSPALPAGDWAALSVAKSGYYAPPGFYAGYKKSAREKLREANGVLSERKYTEYARAVLALTALGEDARNFGGYDLTERLTEYDKVLSQGINGPVWALLALGCAREYGAGERAGTMERYIAEILSRQRTDGRFTLTGSGGDAMNEPPESDVTAMVLHALAPYKERRDVAAAVDKALGFLSAIQQTDGGYKSRGAANCESAAQVVTALGALGIELGDKRFVKNGATALDAVLGFALGGGAFEHTRGGGADMMAAQQALLALVSARDGGLYGEQELGEGPPFSKISVPPVTRAGAAFSDIAGKSCETAVRELASRGIIDGMSPSEFRPSEPMTRAQFAAVTARALGFELPEGGTGGFDDVAEGSWYARYICSAVNYGLIKGRSPEIFDPEGTITRAEASLLLGRAAKLLGHDGSTALPAAGSRVTRGELAAGLYEVLKTSGSV
jgi:hypothetical protein